MARNKYVWLRRLKRKFPSSQEAWKDIEVNTNYTKRSITPNITGGGN